jgi:hypothetical protein
MCSCEYYDAITIDVADQFYTYTGVAPRFDAVIVKLEIAQQSQNPPL